MQPVILFDGVCNLCNRSVRFIIKRDKKKQFRFASLQSGFGQSILKKFSLPADNLNSFILYENDDVYTKSTGALKVLSGLKGWGWTKIFMYLPRFIRDGMYNILAKNRYKWFGKKDECMVPTPELKDRFL